MQIACLDFEGVLVPEIWINVAKLTGIDELQATTRDVPDYNLLMEQRLRILNEHDIDIKRIQQVISSMKPLPGANEFLIWLRQHAQVALLSDTFYEFAAPLTSQLGDPIMLCHHLETDDAGRITGYKLRQPDAKREAVKAFRALNYKVIAAGDSYNDTSMLEEADAGILFCPPAKVIEEFPQYPVATSFEEFMTEFSAARKRLDD